MSATFEVIVGNIGTVYRGPLFRQALVDYGDYKVQSMHGYGRAAGENVVMLKDGEIKCEYIAPKPPEP